MRIILFPLTAAALLAAASLANGQTSAPSATPLPDATPASSEKTVVQPSPTPASQGDIPSGEAAALPSGNNAGGPVMPKAPAPPARQAATAKATPAPGGGHGLVWVNTKTHVYHKESSRYYGKTKEGKYLTEQAAIAEGDKAAPHGN